MKVMIIVVALVVILISTGIYFLLRSRRSVDNWTFNPKDYDRIDFNPLDYDLVDENNKLLLGTVELTEKLVISEYLPSNSTVLELGARYGAVSLVIGTTLKNPERHVAIEPDKAVWNALETNKSKNGGKFTIIKRVLSKTPLYFKADGYSSRTVDNPVGNDTVIPNITFDELEKETNLVFDALVIDCEGCLEKLLIDFPNILDNMKFVTFEEDHTDICNYDWIKSQLSMKGFVQIRDRFHQVWLKN